MSSFSFRDLSKTKLSGQPLGGGWSALLGDLGVGRQSRCPLELLICHPTPPIRHPTLSLTQMNTWAELLASLEQLVWFSSLGHSSYREF